MAALLCVGVPTSGADAQDLDAGAMIETLKPKKTKTRKAIGATPVAARLSPVIAEAVAAGAVSSPVKRRGLARVVEESGLPTLDLRVPFPLDSSAISEDAKPILSQLALALGSRDLAGNAFILAGHTDERGEESYNQALSERRAAAVRDYLQRELGLAAIRLVVVGFGEERPSDPSDPAGEVNRRVEVVAVPMTP